MCKDQTSTTFGRSDQNGGGVSFVDVKYLNRDVYFH